MTLFVKVDPSIFIRDQPTCDNRLLLHHHKQHSSSEYVRACARECVRVCVLACTVYLTKKHFCVDATNEHVSAVVDSDGCPRELSSVVVVHYRNVCHLGVFGQRQPQHLRRATGCDIVIKWLTCRFSRLWK